MTRFNTNVSIFFIILFTFFIQADGFSFTTEFKNIIQQDTVSRKTSSPVQPVYITSRLITTKPVIDGKLDDECWKKGTWASNFH